jgi:hypothetical protein
MTKIEAKLLSARFFAKNAEHPNLSVFYRLLAKSTKATNTETPETNKNKPCMP